MRCDAWKVKRLLTFLLRSNLRRRSGQLSESSGNNNILFMMRPALKIIDFLLGRTCNGKVLNFIFFPIILFFLFNFVAAKTRNEQAKCVCAFQAQTASSAHGRARIKCAWRQRSRSITTKHTRQVSRRRCSELSNYRSELSQPIIARVRECSLLY